MRTWTLFILLLFAVPSLAQQFNVTPLLESGSRESRVNIVVLGDGYTSSELTDFLTDSEAIKNDLFNASPMKEYVDYFNVYAISVPSNVTGAALDPDNLIDNYFGSTFNFAGIERLLVPTRNDKIVEVLANNFPDYDQVLMVVNADKYGGSGGWVATSSVNSSASEISIHEIGHSFASLSDEYWAGQQFATETPNMTKNSSASTIRWKNWLNEFGIGIIAHPESPIWYKPHADCKMQFLGSPFCAVCKEQFLQIVHSITSPVLDYSPTDAANTDQLNFDLTLIEPDPNELSITWRLNGVVVETDKALLTLESSQLTETTNELEAVVFDETVLNRKEQVYVTRVKWTISSAITSEKTSTYEDRPSDVITAIGNTSFADFEVFPNPSTSHINLNYRLKKSGDVDISVRDLSGRLVMKINRSDIRKGQHAERLNLSSLNSGQYVLRFTSGDHTDVFKFIKE